VEILFSKESYLIIANLLVIALITMGLATVIKRGFEKILNREGSGDKLDRTSFSFLRYVLVAAVYLVGITLAFYSIPALRTLGATILAGAGVLALAVSFASQQALSNIVSGLFIVIFRPFKIGDRIYLKDKLLEGFTEDITLRHTVIRDLENRRIIVPNSIISNEIIVNADYGDPMICRLLEFGISYESSIDLAKKIITEQALKHPLTLDNRTSQQLEADEGIVTVRVSALGDFSVNLRVWIWTKDQSDAIQLKSDLLQTIKERFDAEGIDIPYPHTTVIMKK